MIPAIPLLSSISSFLPSAKVILTALAALFLVTVALLGYHHYRNVLQERDVYRLNAEKAEMAFDLQKSAAEAALASAKEWQSAAQAMQKTAQEMARSQAEAVSEIRRLNDVFAKHDLAKLAARKPALVERRINDGTARIFRLLECSSTPGSNCPN